MVSVLIVLKTPLYLKRPAAMLLVLISILVDIYVIEPIVGFE